MAKTSEFNLAKILFSNSDPITLNATSKEAESTPEVDDMRRDVIVPKSFAIRYKDLNIIVMPINTADETDTEDYEFIVGTRYACVKFSDRTWDNLKSMLSSSSSSSSGMTVEAVTAKKAPNSSEKSKKREYFDDPIETVAEEVEETASSPSEESEEEDLDALYFDIIDEIIK